MLTRTLTGTFDSFDKWLDFAETFLKGLNHRDEDGNQGRPHRYRQESVDRFQCRLDFLPHTAGVGLEGRGRGLVRFAAPDQRLRVLALTISSRKSRVHLETDPFLFLVFTAVLLHILREGHLMAPGRVGQSPELPATVRPCWHLPLALVRIAPRETSTADGDRRRAPTRRSSAHRMC